MCRPLYFFIFSLYSLLFSHAPPHYSLTPSPRLVFSHCQVDRESLSPFIVAWRPIADSGSWYLANAWRTATSVCASLLVESVRVSITVSVVASPVYTSPLFLSPRISSTLPSTFRFPPGPISLFWFWFWPLPSVGLARSNRFGVSIFFVPSYWWEYSCWCVVPCSSSVQCNWFNVWFGKQEGAQILGHRHVLVHGRWGHRHVLLQVSFFFARMRSSRPARIYKIPPNTAILQLTANWDSIWLRRESYECFKEISSVCFLLRVPARHELMIQRWPVNTAILYSARTNFLWRRSWLKMSFGEQSSSLNRVEQDTELEDSIVVRFGWAGSIIVRRFWDSLRNVSVIRG